MVTVTAAMVKGLREQTGAPMMACKKALQESEGDLEKAIVILRKAGSLKAGQRGSKVTAEGVVLIRVSENNQQAVMLELNSETDFVAREQSFIAFADHIANRALNERTNDIESTLALSAEEGASATLDDVRKELVSQLGENVQLRRLTAISVDTETGVVGGYCHSSRIGVLVAIDRQDVELVKDIAMHIAASRPKAILPEEIPDAIIQQEKDIFLDQAKQSGKPAHIIEKMVEGRIQKLLKEESLVNQPFVKDTTMTVGDLLKSKSASVTAFTRFEVGEGIDKVDQDFAEEVMSQVKGSES